MQIPSMLKIVHIIILFLCAMAFAFGLWGGGIYVPFLFGCCFLGGVYVLSIIGRTMKLLIHKLRLMNWRKVWQKMLPWGLLSVQIVGFVGVAFVIVLSFVKNISENQVVNILLSLATVIVGVFATFLLMHPIFTIGEPLALSVNNRLRINVRNNHLFFRLHDVSMELEYSKHDQKTKDVLTSVVKMVGAELFVLRGRCRGTVLSSQTFHTKDAFKWDDSKEELICRVKAVHSISGVSFVREKRFTRSDIQPGEYVNGRFCSRENIYDNDESTRKQYQAIEVFSNAVLPVSILYPIDECESRKVADKLDEALDAIDKLRKNKAVFPQISDYKPVFDKLKKCIDYQGNSKKAKEVGLKQIYENQNKVLFGEDRKRRDELANEVNRLVLYVSHYLERSMKKR